MLGTTIDVLRGHLDQVAGNLCKGCGSSPTCVSGTGTGQLDIVIDRNNSSLLRSTAVSCQHTHVSLVRCSIGLKIGF
jgi:hypothetical protein